MRAVFGYFFASLFAFSAYCISPVAAPAALSGIDGVWITSRESEITIAPCETGYCGYLSKIVVPPEIYAANKDAIEEIGVANFRDYNNKDPNLRNRPMLGLRILNLVEALPGGAYEGEVYNPEDGNSYYGKLEVVGPNRVRLTGCAMFNLVCKSEDWVRAAEPITGAIDPPGTVRWHGLDGEGMDQAMPAPLDGGSIDPANPSQ